MMPSMTLRGRARRGSRGSALVLAILILFAMLALGLLAMRTASQNIAGSGNLRLTKQARFVAEVGLTTVIQAFVDDGVGSVDTLLATWHAEPGDAAIFVDQTGRAQVRRVDANGAAVGGALVQAEMVLPPLLPAGPDPLGAFGEAGGLVTSYEVRVEGFRQWLDPTTDEDAASPLCLMHFTARGVVSSVPVGDGAFEAARDDVRFAEHTLRAGVAVKVNQAASCQRGGI